MLRQYRYQHTTHSKQLPFQDDILMTLDALRLASALVDETATRRPSSYAIELPDAKGPRSPYLPAQHDDANAPRLAA